MKYSFAECVAALRWFGFRAAKAEQVAREKTVDNLVREYLRHNKGVK